MQIAAFNGFPFHDELFGYIIHYCKSYGHELTIFCRTEQYNHYMEFYKNIFRGYEFKIIDCRLFSYHKYTFDHIFLITDDDGNYSIDDHYINSKTIRIDHDYKIRNTAIEKYVAIRPFKLNYRNWALPCYPILSKEEKLSLIGNNECIKICIIGSNYGKYNAQIINRLRCKNGSKIIINAVARTINDSNLLDIDSERFEIYIHENIPTIKMMSLLKCSNYIITDLANQPKYETDMMAGAIPLSFSTLTQLILSESSNSYYNFKNAIEFKNDDKDIILDAKNIDFDSFERERSALIGMFNNEINNIIEK